MRFCGVSYQWECVGVVDSVPHTQVNSKAELCPFGLVPWWWRTLRPSCDSRHTQLFFCKSVWKHSIKHSRVLHLAAITCFTTIWVGIFYPTNLVHPPFYKKGTKQIIISLFLTNIPVCKCQCRWDHRSWAEIFRSRVCGRSPSCYYSKVHSLHSSSWLIAGSCAMLQSKHHYRVCADDLDGWPHAQSAGDMIIVKHKDKAENKTDRTSLKRKIYPKSIFVIKAHFNFVDLTLLATLHTLQKIFSSCRSAGFSCGFSGFLSSRLSAHLSGTLSECFFLCLKTDRQNWPQKCM